MRQLILLLIAMLFAVGSVANPAKPGLWKTITLDNGTSLRVQLCGDERCHFWQADDGRRFMETADGTYREGVNSFEALRATGRTGRLRGGVRRAGSQPMTSYTGRRKGLIILAEFQNKFFADGHDQAFFNRMANERGFSEGRFKGSVSDYFHDQSNGLFQLDFDVVGPVRVLNDYEHYGAPSGYNIDAAPWEMVVEACDLVAGQVDWSQYDWDGDGYIEQVFVLYAGQGQSDSYDTYTIWPHEYQLSLIAPNGVPLYGAGHPVGDYYIDTYACSNELAVDNTITGIGTICHEFSHCLGLPDLYDVNYGGNFGMGHWDLMANGGSNDDSFCPAGYTSYERMVCGWLEPVALQDDMIVDGLKPLADGGGAYVISNQAYPDEYYLIENRQPRQWDAALPGAGLLVIHVDYDTEVWRKNIVNSTGSDNPHQRMTLIHADNDNDRSYWQYSGRYFTKQTEATDTYPYSLWNEDSGTWSVNDSLTDNSMPAAEVYHANVDGSFLMNRAIQAITQQADGTVAFRFEAKSEKQVYTDPALAEHPDLEGAIFYESFNRCAGTGGNDRVLKGGSDVASGQFLPDNEGWQSAVSNGGARCAKFGNAGNDGIVTTPTMMLTGEPVLLFFRAAPWSRDDTSLTVTVQGDGRLEQADFQMTTDEWTRFSTTLTGTGPVTLTFTPGRRFFLDDVLVTPNFEAVSSGIHTVAAQPQTAPQYYDLMGRRVAVPDRHGLYIVNGRKVVR
ncbi:MAG: M6 family metalloprotease domain-containing protein [Prevotella sp.]|nr:M6 family metalloprotease domain-containing protein [Prevotella sp.]MBQ9187590.1 M6 family metalloprotease domain-containing protein [Prevotella sp.]